MSNIKETSNYLGVKVGDVFCRIICAEIDYYQVIALRGTKQVVVSWIVAERVKELYPGAMVRPCINKFYDQNVKKENGIYRIGKNVGIVKNVYLGYNQKPMIKMGRKTDCELWNGEPNYTSDWSLIR